MTIKPENLTRDGIIPPTSPEFGQSRQYQHLVFWPRPKKNSRVIPVHAFDDWPHNPYDEEDFLVDRMHWKNPKVVGGVESRGVAKPDFMLYFDADNTSAPVNHAAKKILANLPDYELNKIGAFDIVPRGPCVLIYSPMKMTTYSSFGGGGAGAGGGPMNMTSGNANRLFSLQQLRDTLEFQESADAIQQYKEHDDPMHRVFGGMF